MTDSSVVEQVSAAGQSSDTEPQDANTQNSSGAGGSSESTASVDNSSNSGNASNGDTCQAGPAFDLSLAEGNTSVAIDAVDLGIYIHVYRNDNGETERSYRELMNTGEHQTLFTGTQMFSSLLVADRRGYIVFDIPELPANVTRATLRTWGWQEAETNGNSGVFQVTDDQGASDDSGCETLSLFSIDEHSTEELMTAAFDTEQEHSVDVPIWQDLGEGTVYGSRQYSAQDEENVAPSPTAVDQDLDCSGSDAPCGKWLDHELNPAALTDISARSAQRWALGTALTSIDFVGIESVHRGEISDLDANKSAYPDFLTPLPQLILEFADPEYCANNAACDDGESCNGAEQCVDSTCQPGEAPLAGSSCGDAQICNEQGVCSSECAIDADCIPGNCQESGTCASGACVFVPLNCSDGLACNGEESCDATTGECVDGTPVVCGDGNPCNGEEACNETTAACAPGTPLSCNDDNACTEDACSPSTGCTNLDNSADCSPSNECQVGACDAATGCSSSNLEDGTSCLNGAGECQQGECQPLGLVCPDGVSIATEVILEHSFRGAYNSVDVICSTSQADWKVTSGSYQVRALSFGGLAQGRLTGNPLNIEPATRPYFTFDLSSVSGQVVGAILNVAHPDNSVEGDDNGASETVSLFEVSTASSVLEAVASGTTGGSNPDVPCDQDNDSDLLELNAIFSDLGTGTLYGEFEGTSSDNGTTEAIPLNAAAVTSLSGTTEFWTVGADLSSPGDAPFGGVERVWKGSGDTAPSTRLTLQVCN